MRDSLRGSQEFPLVVSLRFPLVVSLSNHERGPASHAIRGSTGSPRTAWRVSTNGLRLPGIRC